MTKKLGMLDTIDELDIDVLKIVNRLKCTIVNDIFDELRSDRKIAYSTVQAVTGRLAKQNILYQNRRKKPCEYTSIVAISELAISIIDHVIESLLEGNKRVMLDHFRKDKIVEHEMIKIIALNIFDTNIFMFVWKMKNSSTTIQEVQDALYERERKITPYTSLQTVMKRLVTIGIFSRSKHLYNGSFVYNVIIEPKDVAFSIINCIINRFLDGDPRAVIEYYAKGKENADKEKQKQISRTKE